MNLDYVAQAGVTVFGATAIFLVGSKNFKVRRWGFVSGMCSQPFWYITMVAHEQWGLMPVFLLYTLSWLRGFWNNWLSSARPQC